MLSAGKQDLRARLGPGIYFVIFVGKVFINKFSQQDLDACTSANAASWQAVEGPKKKSWRVVEGDLSLLVRKSLYKALDACMKADVISWQAVREPKEKN